MIGIIEGRSVIILRIDYRYLSNAEPGVVMAVDNIATNALSESYYVYANPN